MSPNGHICETGTNCTQNLQVLAGVGANAKEDVLVEVGGVDKVSELVVLDHGIFDV